VPAFSRTNTFDKPIVLQPGYLHFNSSGGFSNGRSYFRNGNLRIIFHQHYDFPRSFPQRFPRRPILKFHPQCVNHLSAGVSSDTVAALAIEQHWRIVPVHNGGHTGSLLLITGIVRLQWTPLPRDRIWVVVAAVGDRGWQGPRSTTAATVSEATTENRDEALDNVVHWKLTFRGFSLAKAKAGTLCWFGWFFLVKLIGLIY